MGISSILNNSNTLGNAANISNLSQLNANVGGINVPFMPLVSSRDYFLTILETWVASIPTNNQFMVLIETFPNALVKNWMVGLVDSATNVVNTLGDAVGLDLGSSNLMPIQQLEPIDGDTEAWANQSAASILTSYPFNRIVGCVFAQGFSIPSLDEITTEDTFVNNYGGFIPGVIIKDRRGYANTRLTLEFLETNTSFVDLVIRPWSILTSHYGLTARNPESDEDTMENMKTNIMILEYTRSYQGVSQIPRKIWTFLDCAPVSVSERQNVMERSEEVKKYKTSWVFRKYNIKQNIYLPVPDLITKISDGNWNNILAI